ncbi:MAG: methylmalonyl-CoA epimerase [Thermoplasmata archaeon]
MDSFTKIDHVGIAVESLRTTLERWRPIVGDGTSVPEEVPSQKVRVAFVEVAGTHLEFLEPTDPESPVGRFLHQRGEGMHHLAFQTPSVDARLAELKGLGLRVIDSVGRPGARGRRVGFAHPSAFQGVLVEFVELP